MAVALTSFTWNVPASEPEGVCLCDSFPDLQTITATGHFFPYFDISNYLWKTNVQTERLDFAKYRAYFIKTIAVMFINDSIMMFMKFADLSQSY